jgi:hypothetical protein
MRVERVTAIKLFYENEAINVPDTTYKNANNSLISILTG